MVLANGAAARANELFGRYPASIDEEDMVRLGAAFADRLARADGRRARRPRIAVGADSRPSSPLLREAFVRGIVSREADAIDVGLAPPALAAFAMEHLRLDAAAAITGGERPLDWNGVRLVLRERPLEREDVRDLAERAAQLPAAGPLLVRGRATAIQILPHYLRRVERTFASLADRLRQKPISVVVAAGHGPLSRTAPHALSRVGCRVVRLRCVPVDDPPCGASDPSDPSLLREIGFLVRASRSDLGLLFGWDGCRLRAVDSAGSAVEPARLFALLAADLASGAPGARVACDLRMSDAVDEAVESRGGSIVLAAHGDASMRKAARLFGARVGGTRDGAFYLPELGPLADDAVCASLLLLDILAKRAEGGARVSLREALPAERFRSPERIVRIDANDLIFHQLHDRLSELRIQGAPIRSIEVHPGLGVRVRAEGGWGAIHGTPGEGEVRVAYEAKTERAFRGMGEILREAVRGLASGPAPAAIRARRGARPSRERAGVPID